MRNVFLIFLLFVVGCGTNQKAPKDLPNIVIILTDDLGYGDISANDQSNKINTVNIDRLASQGMRFTDAHSPSSVCSPTRYGLLTGRYSWRTRLKRGVLTGTSKALIPKDRATIASMLKRKGYKTGFIGKWHLGWDWALKNEDVQLGEGWDESDFENIDYSKPIKNNPNDIGFDFSFGHAASLDMAPYVYVENGRVTQVPDNTTVNTGKYSWWRKGPTAKDFFHEDVTPNFFRRAIAYIEEQSKEAAPFMLYLSLPSPHTPILPTENWQEKSGLNPYGDFTLMVDDYVGQLSSAIEEAGISDNTIVIFTSDNGCSPAAKIDELMGKGHYPSSIYRGHKADIFEGGHRVPFIVRWPSMVRAGSISDETICLTDLMATFAEISHLDLKKNEGEDSFSFLPILEESKVKNSARVATVHHSINGSFAIRKGSWKLIMCPDSGGWSFPRPEDSLALKKLPQVQLYDLSIDPEEKNNVEAKYSDKVKELEQILNNYISEGKSRPI